MTGPDTGEAIGPPATGNAGIDQALSDLSDLESAPLHEHHDRLAQAHAALQAALEAGPDVPRDAPDSV